MRDINLTPDHENVRSHTCVADLTNITRSVVEAANQFRALRGIQVLLRGREGGREEGAGERRRKVEQFRLRVAFHGH